MPIKVFSFEMKKCAFKSSYSYNKKNYISNLLNFNIIFNNNIYFQHLDNQKINLSVERFF